MKKNAAPTGEEPQRGEVLQSQKETPPRAFIDKESETIPARSHRTVTQAKEFRVRSWYAVTTAFADNPQRARKQFTAKRWRLLVRVDEINESRIIACIVHSGDVGAATITMRSTEEVEKLSRHRPAIIEAVVADYLPGTLYPMHFDEGVYIGEQSEVEKIDPVDGARKLTVESMSEMIEIFDRGSLWGKQRYPGRWELAGTVVRKASQRGSSYIIEIPNIGRVHVSFPGGDQPRVGIQIRLDAVPTGLTVAEGGSLLLSFSYPRRKK